MTRGRMIDVLTDAERDELVAAGWRCEDDVWWIDPASGERRYCTTALRLARKDRDRDRERGAA